MSAIIAVILMRPLKRVAVSASLVRWRHALLNDAGLRAAHSLRKAEQT